MTWKISTRRSLPPSMRCRVPRSSRATLFSALQASPISAGLAGHHIFITAKQAQQLCNDRGSSCRTANLARPVIAMIGYDGVITPWRCVITPLLMALCDHTMALCYHTKALCDHTAP